MFMGLGMPIPDLSNKPGPGRPGWGPTGTYDFQFEVTGAVTIEAFPNTAGQSFTIKWQDGTTTQTSGSSTINSPSSAGIISINNELDSTYADEFKIVSGQANVTKVISWGSNAWSNLSNAFNGCTNLTNIENTKLIGAVNCNLGYLFLNCTGLTEALCENWDLSLGCEMRQLFDGCTNLELLNLTGSKLPGSSTATSSYSFREVGSTTTNGCEFKMSGLNFTGTINAPGRQWFNLVKFKDGSNLSNWTFDSALNSFYATELFDSATVNGTLDVSEWNWPSQQFPSFNSVNSSLTSQNGSKIKLTNFDVSKVNNFASAFASCKVYELEGLSTWGACAGNASIYRMFSSATLMRINPNDNFSNTFVASLTPSSVQEAFNMFGNGLQDSELGVCPNLNGLDLSNLLSSDTIGLSSFMRNHKSTNTPDFSNVTFSSTNTVGFVGAFRNFKTTGTGSDSIFNFNPTTVKPANFQSTFYFAHGLSEVNIGSNVDMSSAVEFNDMFRLINYNTAASTFTNVTFPTNADFSSLTSLSRTFEDFSGNPIMSVCQTDNFIRRLKATNNNSNLTVNFYANKVTEAPSVVRSDVDYLENTKGWNITLATPDAALPFAYASYAVDPTGITTISPTVTPPAGSVFTATNSLSINSSTGVITIGSFRGGSTVRCTYPDGCYNEVVMLIQVPFIMRTKIPAGDSNFTLSPQMSAGECFIDWGDTNSETLTGSITHSYAISGSDQEYDIKLFDSPSGSKFTGFATAFGNTEASYEKTILKWGDIEWQNNQWFGTATTGSYKIRLAAPNGADHKPNLSQVTSLERMFGTSHPNATDKLTGWFEDTNDNLEHWDVNTITNMSFMFRNPDPVSTKDDGSDNVLKCANWDVSNVQNFNYFMGGHVTSSQVALNFSVELNIEMTNWDTSGATDMSYMFWNHNKTKTGIENFRTENVTNLSYFYGGGTWNAKTKMYNGILRWDVSNVENFSAASITVGNNETDVNANYPNNWRFSTDATKNLDFSKFCGGDYLRLGGGPGGNWIGNGGPLTDLQAFATKTINETFYGGTSYTAWNMDNASNISNFGGTSYRGYPPGGLFRNYNIAGWNITSKCTSFSNIWVSNRAPNGAAVPFDQDLSGWNVTGVTGNQGFFMRGAENAPLNDINISTSNYNAILTGWGALAASVNSGVTVNFGTSKYSPGNPLAVSRGNVSNPTGIPSGQMFVYDANVVLKDLTSIGDIVQLMNGGSTYGEFAKITGYLATDDRVAFVDVLGGAGFPINWPGITWQYQIYDSDAAKGRYALLDAGWTITDGGVDIAFESAEIEIELAPGQETFTLGTWPMSTKIDWGDGNGFVNQPNGTPYTSAISNHTYPTVAAGTTDIYRIKIRENDTDSFSGFRFGQYGNKDRVRKIIAWGSQVATSYSRAFQSTNLNKAGFTNTLPVDANGKVTKPIWVSSVTNFERSFASCNMPANADWSNWTSGVAATDLSSMFSGNTNFTCTGLPNWDVSNVTNISGFVSGTAFNADISGWDLSSCIYANSLFASTPFNHPSIVNFNLHNITHIASMFQGCTAFNQDVDTKVVGSGTSAYLAWDTSNVNDMHACFNGATSFNYSIGKWKIDLTSLTGLASFFAYVGNNVTGGYTHDLLTKDVTVGAGTPVAKTYVAWDVSSVNGFGSTNIQYPTSMGTFFSGKFNGDITNWDMSGLGKLGSPTYGYSGEWSKMFYNNDLFNQDISRKTITNVSGKGTYTAWGMSEWIGGIYSFFNALAFDQNIGNWALNTSDTSSRSMNRFFRGSGMSTANYTDTFVGWANTVKANGNFPQNKSFADQSGMTFDSNRSGGANFANAWEARSYLTDTVANGGVGWTIGGDTVTPLLVSSTNSLSFNGSTEYVNTAFTAIGNTAMTFSAYVYLDSAWASKGSIMASNFSNAAAVAFDVNASRKLEVFIRNGGNNPGFLAANTAMNLGQWYHVAITISNNGTNNDVTFYLNGSVDNTTGSTQAYGQGQNLSATQLPYSIGTNVSYLINPYNYFKGKIDEVMVWDNVISTANITTLAEAVGSGNVPNPEQLSTGLQLWNRMGD